MPKIQYMETDFQVLAYIAGDPTNSPAGCRVVAADYAHDIQHYTRVFGPASKPECEEWKTTNCVGLPLIADA